ncbi:MAG: ROK family transcriptional regulator [Pyrinomonadaceae bacterium]
MKRIYLQKAKKQIARPNTIRDINRQIVLNYVRDRSPISRADIARETDLQRSTVSSIVDGLQNDGLIEEIGSGDSTGGRKPTLLRLRIGTPVAIGVDVTPTVTNIAVADLAGIVLEMETIDTVSDSDSMSREIVKIVEKFAKKFKESNLEVGISVPGVTEQMTGRVRYIPYFQWKDWDIGKRIIQKTKLPVTIENDANAIALAELWFGREDVRKISNFITVLVAEGVGTGVVFDGQVYRGEKGAAGEFGHMIVGKNAPVPCSCGSFDCWEAHSSEKAIIARYTKLSENGQIPKGGYAINQIIQRANLGEERAISSLKETAFYLGVGIANLVVGLSPQAVVISGRIIRAWNLIADDLKNIVEKSVQGGLPKTVLIPSTLGDHPTLKGSLTLILAKKFASAS